MNQYLAMVLFWFLLVGTLYIAIMLPLVIAGVI